MNQIPIQFAPLQGYTEAPFRNFHEKYFGGVDRYFAPFLRVQHKEIRRKDQRDVLPDKNTVNKLIPQIMASEISEADFLVRFLVEFLTIISLTLFMIKNIVPSRSFVDLKINLFWSSNHD